MQSVVSWVNTGAIIICGLSVALYLRFVVKRFLRLIKLRYEDFGHIPKKDNFAYVKQGLHILAFFAELGLAVKVALGSEITSVAFLAAFLPLIHTLKLLTMPYDGSVTGRNVFMETVAGKSPVVMMILMLGLFTGSMIFTQTRPALFVGIFSLLLIVVNATMFIVISDNAVFVMQGLKKDLVDGGNMLIQPGQ